MNLPEPSGSSPPEKPPGMKIICASPAFFAKLSADFEIPSLVRLLITKISASAPALSTAFAESYSQLVPGNTGIRTLGFATLIAGAEIFHSLYSKASTFLSSDAILQLNTDSSLSS